MRASIAVLLCTVSAPAQATLINASFENGFVGWDTLGDTSVQGAGLGVTPTDGNSQAWLTTLCDRNLSGGNRCQTTANELTYSGRNAIPVTTPQPNEAQGELFDFLGVSWQEVAPLNYATCGPPNFYCFGGANGEASAIKRTFSLSAGTLLEFDYNFLSTEVGGITDFALLTLVSDSFRLLSRLGPYLPTLTNASSVMLCEHYEIDDGVNVCPKLPTHETGYQHFAAILPFSATYTLGFSVYDRVEGTVPSGLLVDNVRVTAVPEPGMLSLFGAGLLAMFVRRRRKAP